MSKAEAYMQKFAEDCEKLLENEEHPLFDAACIISNWITWIWERPRELRELDEELAEVKFLAWKDQLDFHLWGETTQLSATLKELKKEKHQNFLAIFESCRTQARESLADQGYERLCPSEGSLPVRGETVARSDEVQYTQRKELDGRVCKVEPGYAGYRKDNKVLTPAQAVVYRYESQGDESSSA